MLMHWGELLACTGFRSLVKERKSCHWSELNLYILSQLGVITQLHSQKGTVQNGRHVVLKVPWVIFRCSQFVLHIHKHVFCVYVNIYQHYQFQIGLLSFHFRCVCTWRRGLSSIFMNHLDQWYTIISQQPLLHCMFTFPALASFHVWNILHSGPLAVCLLLTVLSTVQPMSASLDTWLTVLYECALPCVFAHCVFDVGGCAKTNSHQPCWHGDKLYWILNLDSCPLQLRRCPLRCLSGNAHSH